MMMGTNGECSREKLVNEKILLFVVLATGMVVTVKMH